MTTEGHIGIDVREWEPGTSTGIARVLTGFIGWAAANTPHRFTLFGNQDTEFRVAAENVATCVEPEGSRLWWDQVLLPRLLAETHADVLLSPYYKGPLRAPCPVVVSANDLIEIHYPRGSMLKRLALKRWMRLVLRRASRVLTLSEFSRRDLAETLGVAATRIDVVPAAVDGRFFGPPLAEADEAIRRRLGLPSRYVLYVGRCTAHKNVQTLVRAWAALPEALQDRYRLVLAGGDDDAFQALAHACGVPVITPGFVVDDDLAALYRGAATLCFPSLYEGFGLPPLEAMACGTPVLASGATSLPEVLGDAALLVDPTDIGAWSAALASMLQEPELRADLIARGRVRSARYTRESAGEQMLRTILAAVRRRDP